MGMGKERRGGGDEGAVLELEAMRIFQHDDFTNPDSFSLLCFRK